MDLGPGIDAALTSVGADPNDPHLRDLATRMVTARSTAERGIRALRSWSAGESTALERAEPDLLRAVADRIAAWQAARGALMAAVRPVQGDDETGSDPQDPSSGS